MYVHRAIKDIFGCSVNFIRKAQNIKFFGGKTSDEIHDHARMMGHSVLTGIRQYLDLLGYCPLLMYRLINIRVTYHFR